jgi:regulator of sigma E protease
VALVGQVSPRSAAFEAGILAGDVITRIDGVPIRDFGDLQKAVAISDDAEMDFTVWREGLEFEVTLKSKPVAIPGPDGNFTNRRLVGISGAMFFEPGTEPLPFVTALQAAVARTWFIIKISLAGLSEMVLGKISACNLSGPVAIAETAGQVATQGTIPFLALIAGLSTAVGLMNLFPIPVLDGGHLLICAYELVTGRKPSESIIQLIMTWGLFFILSLTVFTIVMNMLCP